MAMPNDDGSLSSSKHHALEKPQRASFFRHDIFAIPPPLKRVFDTFPLVVYAANQLPTRASHCRDKHVLHVFTKTEDAALGRPSFNPGCLKWQTLLRFSGIEFRTIPSSNHASPTGVLPFLQPAAPLAGDAPAPDPVSSKNLSKWVAKQESESSISSPDDVRLETYSALLDGRIRKAWLYQLYLDPTNSALLSKLYVEPCSSNPLVRSSILRKLCRAAETELVKSSGFNIVSAKDIIRDAEDAFQALSALLGSEQWFFGQTTPSVFDATVFSYTHLLLNPALAWQNNTLATILATFENLVQHQERIAGLYF